ncbi:MAG: hypothetical protein V3T17_00010 [Pseudomonadales bacterium]
MAYQPGIPDMALGHFGDALVERQQNKLLPVKYFMVTFTIPLQ